MSIKHRLHAMFYQHHPVHRGARIFQIGMALLIVTNALAVMLGTVESLNVKFARIFDIIEWVSVSVFVAEYAVRI